MNALSSLLSADWVQALGWTLVHSLWQGAVISILVAVAMIFLQKFSARIRYFIYGMSLVLLLGTSIATFIRVYEVTPAAALQDQSMVAEESGSSVFVIFADAMLSQNTAMSWEEAWNSLKDYVMRNIPLLVGIWFTGMIFFFLRFLGSLAYTRRLRHYKVYPADDLWLQKIRNLSGKFGIHKPVRLMQSAVIHVPVTLGYFRPLILVPLGFFMQMPPDQIEAVLMHEMAHIRRKDYLINLIQTILEAVYFYHPAIWWISGNIRIERENIADDMALLFTSSHLTYAHALASVQELRNREAIMAPAFSDNRNLLLNRIQRLMKKPRLIPNYAEGFVSALIIMITIAAISATAAISFRTDSPLKDLETVVEPALSPPAPLSRIEALQEPSINRIPAINTGQLPLQMLALGPVPMLPDTNLKSKEAEKAAQEEKVKEAREYAEQAAKAREEYHQKLREAQVKQEELMKEYQEQLQKIRKEHEAKYDEIMESYKESMHWFQGDSNSYGYYFVDPDRGNVFRYRSYAPYRQLDSLKDQFDYQFRWESRGDDTSFVYYSVPGRELFPGRSPRVIVQRGDRNIVRIPEDIGEIEIVEEFESPEEIIIDTEIDIPEDLYFDYRWDEDNNYRRIHRDKDRSVRYMSRTAPEKYVPFTSIFGQSKLERIFKDEMEKDGLIDMGKDYIITLNSKQMLLNGEKQSKTVYKKYRNLVESFKGEEMEEDFEFRMVL